MALLIQKIQNPANSRTLPLPGWLTIQELERDEIEKEKASVREFEQSVSHFLPLAAQRAQELINTLDDRLSIVVPISYLTIENSTTFHVVMLVSQEDYLSPEMQAARLITENFNLKDDNFDMHYTYSIGVEHLIETSMIGNSYKLKHISEFEKNLQVELVYTQNG